MPRSAEYRLPYDHLPDRREGPGIANAALLAVATLTATLAVKSLGEADFAAAGLLTWMTAGIGWMGTRR
jgi:hypothetical protein